MRYTACLSCGALEHFGRGLCNPCYQRARRLGITAQYPACGAVPVPYTNHLHHDAPCLSCGAPKHEAHGLCEACYMRARDYGIVHQYPACGAVPVPYRGYGYLRRMNRLKQYPHQPAIIGATCQPDWQRAVAWESRPQRWATLRAAERRSA